MTAQIIHFPTLPRRTAEGIIKREEFNKQVDQACFTDIPKMARELREKGL